MTRTTAGIVVDKIAALSPDDLKNRKLYIKLRLVEIREERERLMAEREAISQLLETRKLARQERAGAH